MNRLRGTACYLAGPMTAVQDLGVAWRQAITPDLNDLGVVVLDPTNKPIEIGQENQKQREHLADYIANGNFDEVRRFMKVIRRVDLRCIDLSSFVIVRLDGTDTMGTYEEIALSVKEQKPTLIWLDGKLNKKNVNPWLYAQVDHQHIFESWADLLAYLKRIDSSKDHPEERRWMLFEFAKLYGRYCSVLSSTE